MRTIPALGSRVLREDNRAIVRAASQTSKAADYLMASTPDDTDRRTVDVSVAKERGAV